MKLLLMSSSSGVEKELSDFIPKPYKKTKVAHIITAAKLEKDHSYLNSASEFLKELGCDVKTITFENCNKESSSKLLEDVDVIYVQGGNTFYLLEELKKSGAFEIIKEMVKSGTPYVGVSAGSYVVCPTIEMATWKGMDRNKNNLTDFTSFDFVPFLMSVHFEENHREIIEKEIKKTNLEVKILKDGEALLVEDEEVIMINNSSSRCFYKKDN